MLHRSNPLRFATRALVGLAALLVFSFAPADGVGTATAQTVSVEFRTALDPYGSWRPHDRWGEVWVPARVNRGWRPYTVGHWVYSDDYGWYWVAHEREARWGWVVYHYGRWVRDRELGWVWVPGREWAPAWVSWRRGGDHIGWAPLPPERLIVEYRDDPDVWIFVQGRRFTAPLIAEVVVPFDRQPAYFGQTVLVNRTVVVASGGPAFAVNPGIAPTIVSAVVGQPLTTYQVRPVVVAGTANIPNAVTVQASELQQGATQVAAKEVVQETQAKVEPAKEVPEPKPLAENEKGRLGENPPKAAQQAAQQPAADETPGKATADQQQGEQAGDKAAAQEKTGDSKDKAATQQQGDESKDKSAAQEKSNAADDKAAAQQKADEAREDKAATQQKADEPKDKSAAQPANEAKDKAAARKQAEEAKDKATAQQKQADDAKAAAQRKQADEAKGKAATQQRQAEEPKAKSAAEKAGAAAKRSGESARGAAERAAPKQAQQPRPRQAEQAAPKAPAKPQTAGQGPQPAPKAAAPAPRPQAAPEPGPAQGQPKPKPER
jgi:hypothetical protein